MTIKQSGTAEKIRPCSEKKLQGFLFAEVTDILLKE